MYLYRPNATAPAGGCRNASSAISKKVASAISATVIIDRPGRCPAFAHASRPSESKSPPLPASSHARLPSVPPTN
ncbi:MAG: hypothetical protein ACK527_22590, partial [Acidobacteriota bacterium]